MLLYKYTVSYHIYLVLRTLNAFDELLFRHVGTDTTAALTSAQSIADLKQNSCKENLSYRYLLIRLHLPFVLYFHLCSSIKTHPTLLMKHSLIKKSWREAVWRTETKRNSRALTTRWTPTTYPAQRHGSESTNPTDAFCHTSWKQTSARSSGN